MARANLCASGAGDGGSCGSSSCRGLFLRRGSKFRYKDCFRQADSLNCKGQAGQRHIAAPRAHGQEQGCPVHVTAALRHIITHSAPCCPHPGTPPQGLSMWTTGPLRCTRLSGATRGGWHAADAQHLLRKLRTAPSNPLRQPPCLELRGAPVGTHPNTVPGTGNAPTNLGPATPLIHGHPSC